MIGPPKEAPMIAIRNGLVVDVERGATERLDVLVRSGRAHV